MKKFAIFILTLLAPAMLASLASLASCAGDPAALDNTPEVPTGTPTEVLLDISVEGLVAGDEATRAAQTGTGVQVGLQAEPSTRTAPADLDAADNAPVIHNMWIIQFAGTSPSSRILGSPQLITAGKLPQGAFPLETSIAMVMNPTACYTLFIANLRDENFNWNFSNTSTFSDVITRVKTLRNEDATWEQFTAGNSLLMSALTTDPIAAGTTLSPVFKRDVAKLTLDLTLSNPDVRITQVRLRGVSDRIAYADVALEANGIRSSEGDLWPVDATLIDYDPVTTGMPTVGAPASFSFYVPRNLRGIINTNSTNPKDKTFYAPRNATYFEITAIKKTGATTSATSVFRVYPGADMTGDYNIEANHHYTVGLNVVDVGTDPSDSRVETFSDVDHSGKDTPGTFSNSFILNPAPAGGVSRRYTIPVTQVNRYWGGTEVGYGNDPAKMLVAGDTWTLHLVWTDLSGQYSDVPSLTAIYPEAGYGTGPDGTFTLVVPAGLPAGNFTLGIKKNGTGDWLWSWHFWVTDYNPDRFNFSAIASGRYTYPVPGGQVERYEGAIWAAAGAYERSVMMDRNLGMVDAILPNPYGTTTRGILHYQHGRKDPFPISTLATNPGAMPAVSGAVPFIVGEIPIPVSVANPAAFVRPTGGIWMTETLGSTYRWNDPAATAERKSIYDPCPPGWRVPANGTWDDFESGRTANNSARDLAWGTGRSMTTAAMLYWPGGASSPAEGTIYYPATGYRDRASGGITNITATGYFWFESVLASGHSTFVYSQTNVYPIYSTSRGTGCSVRCVSESE